MNAVAKPALVVALAGALAGVLEFSGSPSQARALATAVGEAATVAFSGSPSQARALATAVGEAATVAGPAGAAPAKAKNACGLLKTSEIKVQFDGDLSKAVSGPGPACNWEIVVGGDPAAVGSGTVGTFLLRTQAKAAFEVGRQTDPDSTDIEGLGKDAYYAPSSGTIYVLKNSKTVFYVQGVFIGENVGRDQDAVPDLEARLTKLAKKAEKRA